MNSMVLCLTSETPLVQRFRGMQKTLLLSVLPRPCDHFPRCWRGISAASPQGTGRESLNLVLPMAPQTPLIVTRGLLLIVIDV